MREARTLGVIMDPIQSIHPEKDTTLAMLIEAQKRGFELYYIEISGLYLLYGSAWAYCHPLQVTNHPKDWFTLGKPSVLPLDQFDVLLMRKDPPVNMEYIYATYILEHAEQNGVLVINKPQSLRDANEKMYTSWFPQCIPPTVVSSSKRVLKDFIEEQETVVLKPLNGKGGENIFKCQVEDPNQSVMIDLLTQNGTLPIMAQLFIPEIEFGDKRILLINGEPIPYALARIPAPNEFRANLAVGGIGEGCELSERDFWICSQIGPRLKEKGLIFVGIDVIGDYLTEINVTSPTCVKELEKEFEIDIAGQIIDCISDKLHHHE